VGFGERLVNGLAELLGAVANAVGLAVVEPTDERA
jgi:hypothetical protein